MKLPWKKETAKSVLKSDGYANFLTGLGDQNRDKRKSHLIYMPPTGVRNQLENIYVGTDLGARVAELPAQEMVRQWFTLNTDDPEVSKAVMQYADDMDLKGKIFKCLVFANVFGGSLGFVGADDGQTDMRQPLNMNNIRSFQWITVLDRFQANIAQKDTNLMSKTYGEPSLYQLSATGMATNANATVHASRFVRFNGVSTTNERRNYNSGWDDSIYIRLDEVLRDSDMVWQSAAHLMTDFAQAVFRIKGLSNAIATDNEDLVLARMRLLDMSRSVARAIPLDEEESFERQVTPMTGMPEMLDKFAKRLSGASGIPVSLLMGESPAGMNATGDSDIRFFYDNIKAKQESILRPALNFILKLIFLSKTGPTKGVEPKNWSFDFNPLWQMSEKETAEIRKMNAETHQIYIQNNVLDPMEVRTSVFAGDKYSSEITIENEMPATETAAVEEDPAALGEDVTVQ